jgi:GNAT superfamily N-acetyltransferase
LFIRTYVVSRLFYEAYRGPRLAAQPENRPRRNLVAPVCPPYCNPVIEVRLCANEVEDKESLAIYNAVWPWDAFSMDEVRSFRTQVVGWAEFLVSGAGSVSAAITPWHPDVARVDLTVLPEQRGRGVGTALYREASAWLKDHGIELMDAPIPLDDPASLEFAFRRGFREQGRSERLVLELSDLDPPDVAPPAGIEIVTWAKRPDLIRGVYDVACEALPDIPGEEDATMEPFEDWLAHDMEGAADRPDATFVALAGEEVVGYAKFHLSAAQPTTAHHDLTGVKRAWRGQGIAGSLKRAQIVWAKENGYERLVTAPELRNEPSRRMNARLGYRPMPGRIVMRGPVAS